MNKLNDEELEKVTRIETEKFQKMSLIAVGAP